MSEDLWDKWARYEPTSHPDIVQLAEEDLFTGPVLHQTIDELIHLAREGDSSAIVNILDECIPGAEVSSTPPPDLTSIV